jgi:hypothetical protein
MFHMNQYGLLFNWTLEIRLIQLLIESCQNLRKHYNVHIQIEKVWSDTIVL